MKPNFDNYSEIKGLRFFTKEICPHYCCFLPTQKGSGGASIHRINKLFPLKPSLVVFLSVSLMRENLIGLREHLKHKILALVTILRLRPWLPLKWQPWSPKLSNKLRRKDRKKWKILTWDLNKIQNLKDEVVYEGKSDLILNGVILLLCPYFFMILEIP